MDKKVVYVMPPSPCYGTRVVNYDADNQELNRFLGMFHIWGRCSGERKTSSDRIGGEEVWFEMDGSFYDTIQTRPFLLALERFGVRLTTEYPFKN